MVPSRLKSAEYLGAKNGGYFSIGIDNAISEHAVKARGGSGSVAPQILNLNTRWGEWLDWSLGCFASEITALVSTK